MQIGKNIFTCFFKCRGTPCSYLSYETKVTSPVSHSWMYPIERSLRTLKQYVCNKARPEGSIAKGYIMNESSIFCSRYLKGIET